MAVGIPFQFHLKIHFTARSAREPLAEIGEKSEKRGQNAITWLVFPKGAKGAKGGVP